jgi:hypothetical protein
VAFELAVFGEFGHVCSGIIVTLSTVDHALSFGKPSTR